VRLAAARRGGADTALVFDGAHQYATVLRGGHLVPEFYIRVADITVRGGDVCVEGVAYIYIYNIEVWGGKGRCAQVCHMIISGVFTSHQPTISPTICCGLKFWRRSPESAIRAFLLSSGIGGPGAAERHPSLAALERRAEDAFTRYHREVGLRGNGFSLFVLKFSHFFFFF
jgi:hypothetical protein